MRTILIQIEASEGRALLRREADRLEAECTTDAGEEFFTAAIRGVVAEREQMAMATALQYALDGFRGTNADIAQYFSVVKTLAD